MPDLFGIDIAGILWNSIQQAGGLVPLTLRVEVPGERGADRTAGNNPTYSDHSGQGILGDYDDFQIQGTNVERGDRRVTIIARSLSPLTTPSPGDRVEIEGTSYNVVAVKRDPAAATFTCQVRGG